MSYLGLNVLSAIHGMSTTYLPLFGMSTIGRFDCIRTYSRIILIDPNLKFTPIWCLTIWHLSFHLMNYCIALQHHRNLRFYENFNSVVSIWGMNIWNLHQWSKNANYSPKLQNMKLKSFNVTPRYVIAIQILLFMQCYF